MSLHRIAARIAAVQALKGKTLVGDAVLESWINALDVDAKGELETDQTKPFITVYTEASTVKGGEPENALRALVPNGLTDFLFEAGYAATMTETDPDTDVSCVRPGLLATDANFEFYLDIVMRQIGDALTDPNNEWAEIFRKFCRSFESVERRRTSSNDNVRLAAHQLRVTVDLWPDPARGAVLADAHPLKMFFAKAATVVIPNPDPTMPNPDYPESSDYPRIEDPDAPEFVPDANLAAQVALMQAQLANNEHEWQMALRRYGMTLSEADAMLLTTPEGAEADVEVVEVDARPAEVAGG